MVVFFTVNKIRDEESVSQVDFLIPAPVRPTTSVELFK